MATESSQREEEGKTVVGKQRLILDEDLRELGKKAVWSVSSCKPGNGVASLRDDNLETYWQSDGAQPHLVNVQFQKKVKLQLVVLYVDFKLDESYTPNKITIRAGDGFHNLKEIKTVELVKPTGWVYISLSGNDPRVGGFRLPSIRLHDHLKLLLTEYSGVIILGNLCEYIHVPNSGDVKSPQWKGYSCTPDQGLWASTEPYSTSTISIFFKRIHYILNVKMKSKEENVKLTFS